MATDHDLSSPVPWRRSQRASAERRARVARSRRRRLRGRTCTLLAVAVTGAAAGGAMAADAGAPSAGASSSSGLQVATVRALQQKLGVGADGVYGARTRAAVLRFQRGAGLAVDGVAGPQTLAALGLRARSGSRSAGARRPAPMGTTTLARIADCESGGDPTAVSRDGAFRGKYQFTRSTWRAMGGTGDPAKAPEAEQDRRAAALMARAGTSPWPVCGH